MERPRVYVSRRIPESAFRMISGKCDVRLHDSDIPPARSRLLEGARNMDGLLVMLSDRIDGSVMDAAPDLQVVSTMSVGFDHIDIGEATRRGIYVTNTPEVLTDAVADLGVGLMLAIARRIVEGDKMVRSGQWEVSWAPMFMLGSDISRKNIGIVGLGRVGTAIARRLVGFGANISYHSKTRKPDVENELGIKFEQFDELLRTSDFLILTVSLTDQTRRMIGEEQIRAMKPSAYIVNVSRGAVVDEAALTEALRTGRIKGAALDVFEEEPISSDHPLTKLPNVVLVPHIGSATVETRQRMAELAAINLLSVLNREMPQTLVNREVLSVRPLR